jgi:hypothetical protein
MASVGVAPSTSQSQMDCLTRWSLVDRDGHLTLARQLDKVSEQADQDLAKHDPIHGEPG